MLRPRVIPCLLIQNDGLVKTVQFGQPKYVGDPINAVKIFNEKEADELIVLDIDASAHCLEPNYKRIQHLAAECRMPLCYGGGVSTAAQAKAIIALGVEKVAISASVVKDITLIEKIAEEIGRQSVVVVLDVAKKTGLFSKGYELRTINGKVSQKMDPVEFALEAQSRGAGEIVINSIDQDGEMKGYDLALAKLFRQRLSIPLTFLGGAGSMNDICELIKTCGVVGAAAGSLFVFKGPYKAVLINYPTPEQKDQVVRAAL